MSGGCTGGGAAARAREAGIATSTRGRGAKAPTILGCASTSRPSTTSRGERPRARRRPRSSAASSATSRGRFGHTSTRNATRLQRQNWRLDDYRSFNALAETVNGLYKAELIRRRERWRTVEEVELATADWVHFWNHRRLHSATDYLPPAEYERVYWRQQAEPIEAA
jgi:transposase InsO family protein